MTARVVVVALALGLFSMVAPGPFETVDEAEAACYESPLLEKCINPGCFVVGLYETVRETGEKLGVWLPPIYCTMIG